METTEKKMSYGKIAGILFAILAGWRLISFLSNIGYYPFVTVLLNLIAVAGFGMTAVSLLREKKDVIMLGGLGLTAASQLIDFLSGFGYGAYNSYDYSYYSGASESFNLFYVLPALVKLVGVAAVLLVVLALTTENFKQYEEMAKKYWFVAPVCIAGSYVLALFAYFLQVMGLFHWWLYAYTFMGFAALVRTILLTGATGLLLMWIACPEGLPQNMIPKKAPAASGTANGTDGNAAAPVNAAPVAEEEGYIGILKHVLLLIFTFGIWQYIWIYKTTGYLNRVEGEEYRNPTTKLLLCMFVPFYYIYWIYKSAQRIDKLSKYRGIPSDLTTLCLILAIFVGIIPPILMQDKINALVTAAGRNPENVPVQPAPQAAPQAAPQPAPVQPAAKPVVEEAPKATVDETEVLKKYKELLDAGIITQEEFDAKKRQVLGL